MNKIGLGGVVLLAALAGAGACGGGDSGTISGVIPGQVFVGREADVLVLGSGTSWGEGVDVNFGTGVTVGDITVASPTALLVHVTADATATLGMRDVTVDDLSYKDAFELASPLAVSAMQGTTDQGSIAIVTVQNLDFDHPFDTTAVPVGFSLQYTNLAVTPQDGLNAQITTVEPYQAQFYLFTDVTAAAGAKDLELVSGPVGQPDLQQTFRFPGAFTVNAREATALTAGTAASATIDQPYASQLFSISSHDVSILSAQVAADSPDAQGGFAILPSSGSFADMITYAASTELVAQGDYYLVYWDGSGAAGYGINLLADTTAATVMAEAEGTAGNNDKLHAQALDALPGVFQQATLADVSDQDWIKIVVSAADAGKVAHVWTYGDPYTDAVVDVEKANGTSMGGPSGDFDYQENFFSSPLPAGTYYVKISASDQGFFDPQYNDYEAAVVLEDASAAQ